MAQALQQKKAATTTPAVATRPAAARGAAAAPMAQPGGYAQQRAATAPKAKGGLLGKIERAGETALQDAEKLGDKIKDGAMNAGGEAIGLAEMMGLKYPVKAYEAQVSGQLFRGSRIEDDAHMQALARQGIRGIVNLCAENDMDTQRAQKSGLQPLHIPIIDNTAPTLGQVQTFLDFVGSKGPAYVHCEAGQGRTGTMVACYRIAAQGWTAEAAVAEAQGFGMKMPCQMEFIRAFAATRSGAKTGGGAKTGAKTGGDAKSGGDARGARTGI